MRKSCIQASFSEKNLRELATECPTESMQAHAKTHNQNSATSFQANKTSLLSSTSSQKQNYQSITQDDKTTDTDLSFIQIMTKINQTTDHIKKITTSLDGQTSVSLDQIGKNQKMIMAQNEEALTILHRIVDRTERIEARQKILLARQNACCCCIIS